MIQVDGDVGEKQWTNGIDLKSILDKKLNFEFFKKKIYLFIFNDHNNDFQL